MVEGIQSKGLWRSSPNIGTVPPRLCSKQTSKDKSWGLKDQCAFTTITSNSNFLTLISESKEGGETCFTMEERLGQESSQATNIHTYHCICTNLIFASTRPASSLARRSAGLDKCYILPLPPPPRTEEDIQSSDDETTESTTAQSTNSGKKSSDYALLLSTSADRKPMIIRGKDGFEKRYLQRCGRCRTAIGYQLDWAQYPSSPGGGADSNESAESYDAGRREDVVFLLPGGIQSTEEMMDGKDMSKDIRLGSG